MRGWRLVPDRYDDGGPSGASLDRPALQNLLADVRLGKITIVVVYKVDRLKRATNAVARQVTLKGSVALLAGRLFDDRGNRMSPTHANKRGVHYRYYVSHAILQNRKTEAGSIARVPAPDIENLVCDGVRRHLAASGEVEPPTALADRELIERHVARVSIKPQSLEVCLIPPCEASDQAEDPIVDEQASGRPQMATIRLAWTAPNFSAVKGIIHAPCAKPAMRPESRDALLTAIAKARRWIDDIRLGRVATFAEVAAGEAQGERHIRLLAPLAFLSPRMIAAIVDGTAPANLTVTGLAKALPYSWAEQEQRIGLSCSTADRLIGGAINTTSPASTPDLGGSTKAPSMAVERGSHARQAERLFTNRSLLEIEPVSTPPKPKLESSEQRPAPETQAQRTQMREIAGQRLGRPA